MASLLFYSNKTFLSKLIQFRTVGKYDHVELMLSDGAVIGSDPIHGVHRKHYSQTKKEDIRLDIPWLDETKAVEIFEQYRGEKYDFTGVFVGQLIMGKVHDKLGWFCSELCAECMSFEDSWRYSPQTLYLTVTEINNRMLQHDHTSHA